MTDEYEQINHNKIRDEMNIYIAQMKSTGFVKDDYLSKMSYVELLRAVTQIEHINLEYRLKQMEKNKVERLSDEGECK